MRKYPRVEYSLSPPGRSITPVLDALKQWGDANIGLFGAQDRQPLAA